MSEVKVNKITPTADCGTVTLGDSGDTVAIPSGVTLTSAGSITNSGTITNTGTISGGTISGTIDGQVNWQTTVKTTAFTATAGEGYFCNTTSAAFTVTLPASPSAGDIVGIKDYANTADTNNITIGRNGSNIQGTANDFVISTEGLSIVLIYVDSTKGWLSIGQAKASDISSPEFTVATGGTITTCGDFKIHTFTGPGTFTVTQVGNAPTVPSGGPSSVDYLIVAGGGSGGAGDAGGGGGGGFRYSAHTFCAAGPAAPIKNTSGEPVSVQAYPITVGGGGSGQPNPGSGNDGSNSVFATKTSAGGGGGGASGGTPGRSGGSGGGGAIGPSNGGTGNTPPVSPSQGNNGGPSPGPSAGGGGGGSISAGTSNSGSKAGDGGNAAAFPTALSAFGANGVPLPSSSPLVSVNSYAYAGGGGGGSDATSFGCRGLAPSGGGGQGSPNSSCRSAASGTTNSGGGGGGAMPASNPSVSGAGGSGIVVIRYKFQ